MQSSRSNELVLTTLELAATDALTTYPWDEDRWPHAVTDANDRAEARGFEAGYALEDWLAAEAEAECWDFYPELGWQGALLSGADDVEGR